MEQVFETLLRWLGLLNIDFDVVDGHITVDVVDDYFELVEKAKRNIALNSGYVSSDDKLAVFERREFIDGFWGKVRYSFINLEDRTVIEAKFLGYEALVNNSIVLVDSISSLMELED